MGSSTRGENGTDNMTERKAPQETADIVDALRAECHAACDVPRRPDGPNEKELQVLCEDVRWRAAAEIERLRGVLAGWQPMQTAPKDQQPVLLYCPGLSGHAARDIVVGVWRFDANRRTFGFWVSDIGHLDSGVAETGPWIEYVELHPQMWAPLPPPPGPPASGD
jgi:hypothetical protein